ncbi:hypothetical protein [Mycolicibacterium llatzerense]|uniref:hypothetical protein n=1 Tax=Mycolicibacterium llatzerense TaxID=280871 RepID=UPI00103ABEB4|nr:hypothetical protein [Mycolicibacterium llatzerense]
MDLARQSTRDGIHIAAMILVATVACAPTTRPAEADKSRNIFPNLSSYAVADTARYDQVNRPRSQGFMFTAPNGLICASNAYPDNQYEQVSCRGELPSEGTGDWSVRAGRSSASTIKPITGDPDFQQDKKNPPPMLPPMHKLTASKGDAICAVDTKGMTACRVGDHGFILAPDRITLF